MSLVLDADRRYSEVCWLEAHNAYASSANRWLYNQQTMSFDELYDFGVRCFSIDVHWHKYGIASCGKPREIAMMHGDNGFLNTVVQRQGPPQRFEVFLERLSDWLHDRDKSRDVITVTLESYINDYDSIYDAFAKYDLTDYMYNHPSQKSRSRWNQRSRWPTLGKMRQAGTRLVVFSNNSGDIGTGINYDRSLISANHWNYKDNPDGSVLLRTHGSLVKFNHIQPNSVNIGSRYAKFNSLEHLADRANAFRDTLEAAKDLDSDGSIPNFVNVDHVGVGSAKNLVERFNNAFAVST